MADEPLFVDTNVFLRFLTNDHPQMSAESRQLFERAEAGEFDLSTSPLVLAEIVWTLQSVFRRSREEVAVALGAILNLRSLRVEHREMLWEAVRAYASQNVDFIDAYHAADLRRRGNERACSYDRDFDKLGIERIEPGAVT